MRQPDRSSALVLLLASACTTGGSDVAPETISAPSVRVSTGASGGSRSSRAIVLTDEAWPRVPTGLTKSGAMWQTVRHETIAVHFALPDNAKVTKERLPFGHPVVRVSLDGVSVDITYSSGGAVFAAGLSKDPPTVASLPLEQIERDPANTTVRYLRRGERVVKSWVRGAECTGVALSPEQADVAFAFCATVRVPPPGPLVRAGKVYQPRFARMPRDAAVVESHGVAIIYAGHFVAKVFEKPCSTDAELRAANLEGFALEHRTTPGGDTVIGTSFATYDDARFRTNTSVWATRDGTCCTATILESLSSPTDAQLDYIVQLCSGRR